MIGRGPIRLGLPRMRMPRLSFAPPVLAIDIAQLQEDLFMGAVGAAQRALMDRREREKVQPKQLEKVGDDRA